MKHQSAMRARGLLVLALLLAGPAIAGKAAAESSNAQFLPLIVRGADVPALVGLAPETLTVFSCKSGSPKPILFQVDELDGMGRVVSRYGQSGRVEPDST